MGEALSKFFDEPEVERFEKGGMRGV